MKKLAVLLLLLLLSVFAWAGPIANPAEYTINLHVSVSRMVLEGNSAVHHQILSVVIDGKKYELASIGAPNALLALGDYKAKLVREDRGRGYDLYRVYELLFPDNKTRQFLVVGQWE